MKIENSNKEIDKTPSDGRLNETNPPKIEGDKGGENGNESGERGNDAFKESGATLANTIESNELDEFRRNNAESGKLEGNDSRENTSEQKEIGERNNEAFKETDSNQRVESDNGNESGERRSGSLSEMSAPEKFDRSEVSQDYVDELRSRVEESTSRKKEF